MTSRNSVLLHDFCSFVERIVDRLSVRETKVLRPGPEQTSANIHDGILNAIGSGWRRAHSAEGDKIIREMIDGAKAAVELRDGVLYLRWVRGAVIDEKDALAAMAAVNRLCQGRRHPMLVDMAATAWLSCKARRVFARPCPVTRIALLGSSPVDRVIVTYLLARCSPPPPPPPKQPPE
jgi:hypothetical protein